MKGDGICCTMPENKYLERLSYKHGSHESQSTLQNKQTNGRQQTDFYKAFSRGCGGWNDNTAPLVHHLKVCSSAFDSVWGDSGDMALLEEVSQVGTALRG